MANCDCEVALVSGPLDLTSPEATLGAGALENGKQIDGIEYEAHREMAEHQLREIAQEAAERFDLLMIKLHHCIGFVAVGETSLFLRVAAPHRGAAFEAGRWTIDELKKRIPIWKSVRFRVGSAKEKERSARVLA